MDWGSIPWWVWAIVLPLVAAGLLQMGRLAYRALRNRFSEDVSEEWRTIFEIIDWVLDALEKETKRRLAEIDQAEVEAAARDVYARWIAGTVISKVMSQEDFVTIVVEQWRKIVGVQVTVSQAVVRVQAVKREKGLGPAPPLG
jgi:hypothetical protein